MLLPRLESGLYDLITRNLCLGFKKYHNSNFYLIHRDGYEGDPFVRCTLNPCLTSPCGVNAECKPGEISILM